MKPQAKPQRRYTKPPSKQRRTVRTLAAQGFSLDVIAAKLGLNKNHLRAEHALDLHAGREIKAAEKERAEANAVVLTKDEEQLLSAIRSSFANGYWVATFLWCARRTRGFSVLSAVRPFCRDEL
jgi:DNA-binding transcriptional MerR regulator